jgi:predicted MFS family arabinose efflux permease
MPDPASPSVADARANTAPGTAAGTPAGAVAALSLAAFGSAISMRVTDPLLPRLAAEFGVAIGDAAAAVITAFALAYGVAQLFFGPIGDRFGKYRVIAWGCAASALTAALCGLAPTLPILLVARLLAGATAASIIPLAMAWIGDVVPYEQRQPVLARFLVGQVLGIASGVLLGGFAADHLDWRAPFFIIAAVFGAVACVLFATERRLPPHARRTHPAGTDSALERMLREFGAVLALPWARRIVMVVFLEGAFLYGVFAFIATHLHTHFGISLSAAGATVMVFGAGGLVYALTAGHFVRHFGEIGLTATGAVLIAASLLVIAFAPSAAWAVPACFVCGLGFYMLHNTLQTNATQMAPERRGAAVSTFAACFFLGQASGVAVAGLGVTRWGTAPVIAAGAAGVLAVGLAFSRMRAARPA